MPSSGEVVERLREMARAFNLPESMRPTTAELAADKIEEAICSRCDNAGAYHDEGTVKACPDCSAGHYLQGREEAREGEDEFKAEADKAWLRVQAAEAREAELEARALSAEGRVEEMRAALTEAGVPLEVLLALHRFNPYKELSPNFFEQVERSVDAIRAALAPQEDTAPNPGERS